MRLEELFRYIRGRLKQAGVVASDLEAEWIIQALTSMSAIERIKSPEKFVETDIVNRAEAIVERRAQMEPLAHILGQKDFFGLTFKVNPAVLTPRPETEHLVEAALEWIQDHFRRDEPIEILELGLGSGCVSVSLLHLLPELRVTAIEISAAAIAVAKENAENHGVVNRLTVIEGDAAHASELVSGKLFDVVVANPPYIEPNDRAIEESVRRFEPGLALYSPGGTDISERWIAQLPKILNPKRSAAGFEFGARQAQTISKLFHDCDFFTKHDILKDYSGHNRLIWAEKKG